MGSNEETNAAGTDTRPPMLVESDYDSWKIRIHRYIRGKPNGKLIWKSIQNGPTPHPMITDPPPTDSTIVPAPRKKLDSEFSEEENKLEMADTQAEIILSQGLPRHIFNNLNQTSTAKEIWDNVEMLMQGSGRTIQQRKEDLFDEYERFRAIGNESIHDYFVRFHKLVNDMKITQLNIPTHQMNTKFVNNLPAYWGKYVTNVKQNMDISTTPYVQIYTHLKAYEPHAKKTLKKQEQSTSIVDPLAYVAHTTTAPVLPSPSTSSPQPTAQSSNDALMATMTQIANLLSGFQKQFPPTNNQLRTSSNSRTHATVHDGHIVTEPVQRKAPGNVGNTGARGKKVICYNCRGEGHVARQCKEPKRKMDSQYFKDKALLMEAKEKGDVLDAEAEAFLADVECTAPYDQPQALTTTNMFQANHEDAYDSDVDEGPNAAVAFMANLSSTSATNNPVNEVHSNDNQIFDNVDYRYIRGKPNGKLIWKSIQNGPTPHPMITDPPPTDSTIVPAPRKKLDSEFSEEENKLEMADTQAEIILSQGLPRHIFNNLNQTSTAKEIWDNVEMLMQGSGRTIQQRKEDLFDEYERFRAIGNESIHDYFVRFHKLVNDMKITQLNIPTHQMNTKFVNNLPAYWGKYVTNVKQNMDISTTPYVQIYTHLKAYEPHAKKTLKKQEQSTSIVDPLAYVAHTTSAPALSSPSTPSPQPTAQSPNDALMATMTQIANLLSGFQKQFPPTNNQLRTSSNSRTHATVHDGHIVTEPVQRKAPGNVGNTGARGKKVICYNCRGEGHVARQCKEPKRKMDSQYFKDKALLMEAKEKGDVLDAEAEAFLADVECTAPYRTEEKGDVLDAEAEAFLADVECTAPYDQPQALTTTNMFQANHEDAYDSDVDEGPNAAAAFMANLSSTSATNNSVNE
ncbi:retrovirus-related pol polyprotein from transposon TNT 1-94, partial [Tanacetum coccineum]